jgi:predicted metal-dependent peptidase
MSDKIKRELSSLMLKHPLFATLSSSLSFKESEYIKTFRLKNNTLTFNPKFIDGLDREEIEFVLANAALHKALKHDKRGRGKKGSLWYQACDFAINSILSQNDFKLPNHINFNPKFFNLSAEEIYEMIRDEFKEDVEDREKEDVEDVEDSLFLEELINTLQKSSNLPKGLEKILDINGLKSQVDWRRVLQRYITSHLRSDYRFSLPNKKYIDMGVILPSLYSEDLEIVIAIDISGSIDREVLQLFLEEVRYILSLYPSYMIKLLTCDEKIRDIYELSPSISFPPITETGGGTDFREVFRYVDKSLLNSGCLIYFSDLNGIFPKESPPIDTLWVVPKGANHNPPPFGEMINID